MLVHLGQHEWLIVDSCMVDGKQPALSLLKAYGIPLSKVKLVVATHWHTDHIRGLTEVVSSCQAAEVYSYSALFSRELLAFASGTIDAIAKSCVKELEGMLYALDNRQLRYATVGRQIWSREDEACAAAVWSLAPTDSDVEAALDNVLRRLRRVGGGGLKPNEVSIPLVVTLGSSALLLGADYEPEKKWRASIDTPGRNPVRSEVYKVAHHGSKKANPEIVWEELLLASPLCVLTPFRNGRTRLPNSEMTNFLGQRAGRCFTTSHDERVVPEMGGALAKTIRETTTSFEYLQSAPGWIKARQVDGTWQVSHSATGGLLQATAE